MKTSSIIVILLFFLLPNYGLTQETPLIKGTLTKHHLYFDISNSESYTLFFDKQIEKVKLTERNYVCQVDDNRYRENGDTLILDLSSRLDSVDSIIPRVVRHLNYSRWIPTYIEPNQFIGYKIPIKRKQLKGFQILKLILEIDDKIVVKTIKEGEIKRYFFRNGKML